MCASIACEETAPEDHDAVEHLLDLSFGSDRRSKTSYRLREGNAPVPGLSLVVRDPGVSLAGTISFWPLAIGDAQTPALLLGPLAVHPDRQGLGIGLELMREGLARARIKGHALVLLVGDEPYYSQGRLRQAAGGSDQPAGPGRSGPLPLSGAAARRSFGRWRARACSGLSATGPQVRLHLRAQSCAKLMNLEHLALRK
jgi:predicted N-acetyltransferase YhbS